MSTGEIEANEKDIDSKNDTIFLRHIHLGVFFDGTSNNMVHQASYSSSMHNLSFFGLGQKNINEDSRKIYNLRGKIHRQRLKVLSLKMADASRPNPITQSLIVLEEKKLEALVEEIETASSTFSISDDEMYEDATSTNKGYSNIAILYSLFNEEKLITQFGKDNKDIYPYKIHKIYIEGAGSEDMAANIKINPNGLGFGLGVTGVTSLVSKAIKRVTEYINSLDSNIDTNTKLHLYVYGFSRGATCARLFSYITTRGVNDKLPGVREQEFTAFLKADFFENMRLSFLEKKCAHHTKLTSKNISIDILGIYDTVASIGFLKRKDGWSDSLRKPYANMPNYIDNWHYRNVYDYGLYLESPNSRSQIKRIFHIGALDEYRENFAFTDIGIHVPSNAVEVLIPGCHSDVGGGYMSGLEQEISLPLYIKNDIGQIRTSINLHSYCGGKEKTLYISDNTPAMYDAETKIDFLKDVPYSSLGIQTLTYVGWLENFYDDKGKKREKSQRKTYSLSEHDHKGYFKVVYFKRFVKRGWSDVSLEMMIRFLPIFKSSEIYNYETNLDSEIKVLGNNLIKSVGQFQKGQRYWITIGGDISSDLYKKLRLNYLHFTSTCSLMHFKNPLRNSELNMFIDGDSSNVGNKPNFDLKGLLCRINYHGDRRNYDKIGDYRVAVHYLDELFDSSIKIDITKPGPPIPNE